MITLIFLGIVAVLLIYAISLYNHLVTRQTRRGQSMGEH